MERGLSRGGGHHVCISDGSPEVAMRPLFARAQGEGIRELESLREGLLEGGSESGEPNRVGVSIGRFQ